MGTIAGWIRALFTRLIPAILTALGVVLVTAGLLSYGDPANAGVLPTPSPSTGSLGPAPSLVIDTPSAAASGAPGASATPAPSSGPAVATRIVIPALQIDLPIVDAPAGYPYCNVAMYYSGPDFGQPGQGKPIFVFAHARDGMFGPIYNLTIVKGTPNKMVNDLVQVYTSDNKLYQYVITDVFPHQTTLDRPASGKANELWLQTSEGYHIPPKTQVRAVPLSSGNADPKDAHPTPHPVNCG